MTTYTDYQVLITGLGFPEALRWHDGALWYADWAGGRIYRLGRDRQPRTVAQRSSFPLCFDLLDTPGGARPLLVSTPDRALLLAGPPDQEPTPYASLAGLGEHPWNELVLATGGSAYVNNIGFAYDGSTPPSEAGSVGFVVLVRPDGTSQRVAEGLAFPNGMAVTDGGRTLLVAESWGSRIAALCHRRRRDARRSPGLGRDPGPAPGRHRRPSGRHRLVRRRGAAVLRPGAGGWRGRGPGGPAAAGVRLRGRRPG